MQTETLGDHTGGLNFDSILNLEQNRSIFFSNMNTILFIRNLTYLLKICVQCFVGRLGGIESGMRKRKKRADGNLKLRGETLGAQKGSLVRGRDKPRLMGVVPSTFQVVYILNIE